MTSNRCTYIFRMAACTAVLRILTATTGFEAANGGLEWDEGGVLIGEGRGKKPFSTRIADAGGHRPPQLA